MGLSWGISYCLFLEAKMPVPMLLSDLYNCLREWVGKLQSCFNCPPRKLRLGLQHGKQDVDFEVEDNPNRFSAAMIIGSLSVSYGAWIRYVPDVFVLSPIILILIIFLITLLV